MFEPFRLCCHHPFVKLQLPVSPAIHEFFWGFNMLLAVSVELGILREILVGF